MAQRRLTPIGWRESMDDDVADPPGMGWEERPGALTIRLHGVPSAHLGDRPVRLATRHAQLALYLLAIAGSDGIPGEQLIDTLWHGVAPHRGASSMRTMLWQMRRGLEHEAWRVRRHRGSVLLDVDGAQLDFTPGEALHRDRILTGWSFRIPPAIESLLIVAA